jgi:predicted esterase YcpF (UPF0227 family)
MSARLVYLHGFNSAPQSHKAQVLQEYLLAHGLGERFACPALPHLPSAAIEVIEQEISRHRSPVLVGSSLGGFYATYLAEKHALRAVLINPAVSPQADLASLVGLQHNLYTGEAYELTGAHIDQWRALVQEQIRPENYLLMVETGDEVLDYRLATEKYRGARTILVEGGDHSFRSFPQHLPALLEFAGIR